MPLRIADSTPRFAGDGTQLVNFLESVERLAEPLGLTDKEIIKYALKYTAPKHRQLLSYREFDNYVEFADHVLDFWPECGVCHYTRPIFEKLAAIDAPLASTPLHPERAQEQPEAAIIAPIPETYDAIPAPVVQETHHPEVEDTAPLPLAPMSQSDLVCSSHFSAPNQVPPAAPELQYATPVDQSTPLDDPCITDETALFNDSSSCSSTECPSGASDAHHMDHVPDDQDAYLDHARTTPEETCSNALMVCMNVPQLTRFTVVIRRKLSRSKAPISMLPPIAYQAVQDNVLDDLHAFSLSAQCTFDIWKFHVFVTDTVLILALVTSYLPLKHSHIGLDSPPTLSIPTLCARLTVQCAYVCETNLGITPQYRVFSPALATKRISSTLQQITVNQMFMHTLLMPFKRSLTHHHRQPRTVPIPYHRLSHASIAFHLYECGSRGLCRRKKKEDEEPPRARPSAVHPYLITAHTS
ncbi:hypothetical protein DFJ58DRAFT_735617 [Suillus subalutaceus]|uniref:uncharacterized protein n=1 Tax=Suillus subalutaceus TaxID=48586 RepID=UPI001B869F4A|nr:uncharacterized protein DFJ58DRAFT_735617 [Suillus subalutaceus]KAG1835335.1 hypothetical protein DFJ58DRAFT_735617 [Suillus subalutaceus]